MEQLIRIRQFDANGRGLDVSWVLVKPFELHVALFDMLIVGCAYATYDIYDEG